MACDFEMFAGDSKTLRVTVKDDAGQPVDLANAEIRFEMARYAGSAPLVVKSLGDGITIIDQSAGRFDVALLPADTEELRGCYYYEAELTNLDIVSTVLTGSAM